MANLSDIVKKLPEIKMDESKKKATIICVAVAVAVIILYALLLFRPSMTKLSRLRPKVSTLKRDIKAVRKDLNFEDNLLAKRSGLQDKMRKYANKLSREKELPVILGNLSDIAKKSRVKILGITPGVKGGKGAVEVGDEKIAYREHPIVIMARSGYHDLGIFINRLEKSERFLQVSDIKIKASPKTAKKHDITFVVYAYTFKGE